MVLDTVCGSRHLCAWIVDRAIFYFDEPTTTGLFGPLVSLIFFSPGLAVSVCRLHDLDWTGWWLLIVLTIIGINVPIIWDCIKGTAGANRFGPDPLAGG